MKFPRVIIADENRPGKTPAGVLLASALKEKGYNLRLFVGSVDEPSLRTLQVLCNQQVTLLNPQLCMERENLRWLFQQAASEDAINLVLLNLGGRWTEDSPFRISKEAMLLPDWLDCDLIPVVYGDSSATIAARTVSEIMQQMKGQESQRIHSVLYRSVLNHREYELLDRAAGRQLSWMTLGYVPRNLERDTPIMVDICTEKASQALLPVRSAAMQLRGLEQLISWPFFSAVAHAAPNWTPQVRLVPPLEEKVRIAVVRHPSLMLGGNGTELLLNVLGCEIVDAPVEGNITATGIQGIYIPHGLGFMTLTKFFSNAFLKTLITRGAQGQFFMLAEGAAAPLLGEKMLLPKGESVRGLGVMSFTSTYRGNAYGAPFVVAATARQRNPLLRGQTEFLMGYTSGNLSIFSDDPSAQCWDVRENPEGKIIGADCWCQGRAMAIAMRPEFWSCPVSFRRWLEG